MKDSGRTLHTQGGYNIMNIRLKELEDKIKRLGFEITNYKKEYAIQ